MSIVRLRSSARPVRRGPGEVQFGLSPGHGIVLAGLSEQETKLLLSLEGSAGTSRDVALAKRFGVHPQRVRDLVAALHGHDLLEETSTPRPDHRDRSVWAPGRGNVVEQIRSHLVAVGVGSGLEPAARVETQPSPDLVVLCASDAVTPDVARIWQDAGTPHLPVILRDGAVVVGPLVLPGSSPCLRCLDLHRRDRDHAWPSILTQISSPACELGSPVEAPPAQAATIAALVAMIAVESLSKNARVTGLSWELSLPWPAVHTRAWTAHPECDCLTSGSSA